MTQLIPLFAFVFGTALVAAAAYALMPSRAAAIDRRLDELRPERQDAAGGRPRFQSVIGMLKRLGEKAPRSPREMGNLRLRLVRAGFRRDEALTMFFGIRVAFALGLFACFSMFFHARPNTVLMVSPGGLGLGYLLPGMMLSRMAKRRTHRIRLSLADMLDLLVVSVEAGLGLDQAMQRVGQELSFAYPELSDELRPINLELRAGKPRSEAQQPGRPHRRRRPRVARHDADPDRQVRHQRRTVAARLLRDAAHQAASTRRGSGGEDRREDGLSAGLLHLPGDLGRHHRTGRDPLHHGAVPADRKHEIVSRCRVPSCQ